MLGLVVAPSQELAIQIVRAAESLLVGATPAGAATTAHPRRHLVAQAVGGANLRRQVEALKKGRPVLVVGTPGRLAELSQLGALRLHLCRTMVLDEADELLDGVFSRHLAHLASACGRALPGGTAARQTSLVSATLPPRALQAYAPWCAEPAVVRLGGGPAFWDGRDGPRPGGAGGGGDEAADGGGGDAQQSPAEAAAPPPPPALPSSLTHHFVAVASPRDRVDAVRRAIYALDSRSALVFLNFGRRVAGAVAALAARGLAAGGLHGAMGKEERGAALAAFRSGKLRALLVTDLAARGLDVPQARRGWLVLRGGERGVLRAHVLSPDALSLLFFLFSTSESLF